MSRLLLSLGELTVGVLLLIDPIIFTNGIIVTFGIALLAAAIVSVCHYFKKSPIEAAQDQDLTEGLMEAVVGLFFIIKGNWIIQTFPLLTVLYGVVMLGIGISKVQWIIDLYRMKVEKWSLAIISAAVTLICSIVILWNPFTATSALWTFIAVTFITEAVCDVAVTIFARAE